LYPTLWVATELKHPRLMERLLQLGVERATARAERVQSTMQWFDEVKSLT
jgi:hypothetical protein